jgi:hypothetical protein
MEFSYLQPPKVHWWEVPTIIVPMVTATCATIVAVVVGFIANFVNWRIQVRKEKADKAAAEEQRNYELLRNVYLSICKALMEGYMFVPLIFEAKTAEEVSAIRPSKESLDAFASKELIVPVYVSRVIQRAQMDTVEGQVAMQVTKRHQLDLLQQVQRINRSLEDVESEIATTLHKQRRTGYEIDTRGDAVKLENLKKTESQLIHRRDALTAEHNQALEGLIDLLVEKQAKAADSITDALIAIRKDFGTDTNESEMREYLDAGVDFFRQTMSEIKKKTFGNEGERS